MTNEKAIHLLHRLQDEQFDGQHGDERREALEMAVRALEGDGDTISRQAAIDAIERLEIPEDMCVFEILSHIELEIGTLPSAQPERKKGKWIKEVMHYKDESQDFYYERTCCSVCGVKKRIGWYDAKYCPRCGADMRGESDE